MIAKIEHSSKSSCPVACALDVIGDHWNLIIIRDIMFIDKHEFKEFLESNEGISTNILSNRLKQLKEQGIISSIPHPDSKKRKLYYLTNKGKDLIYIIIDLAKWANSHLKEVISIPDSAKPLLNLSQEEASKMILSKINQWEQQFVK